MKAQVQYNDLVGTTAADISDYYLNSLNKYLEKRYPNFESEKYFCVGCELYTSYGQYPYVRFICRDVNDSTYHKFKPESDLSLMQFFELFKRFSIVIGRNIDEVEIDENEQPFVLSEHDKNTDYLIMDK